MVNRSSAASCSLGMTFKVRKGPEVMFFPLLVISLKDTILYALCWFLPCIFMYLCLYYLII
jgi:hypothetical protein